MGGDNAEEIISHTAECSPSNTRPNCNYNCTTTYELYNALMYCILWQCSNYTLAHWCVVHSAPVWLCTTHSHTGALHAVQCTIVHYTIVHTSALVLALTGAVSAVCQTIFQCRAFLMVVPLKAYLQLHLCSIQLQWLASSLFYQSGHPSLTLLGWSSLLGWAVSVSNWTGACCANWWIKYTEQ